jgi:hypothetical protein
MKFSADHKEMENWIFKSKRLQNNIFKDNGKIKVFKIYPR